MSNYVPGKLKGLNSTVRSRVHWGYRVEHQFAEKNLTEFVFVKYQEFLIFRHSRREGSFEGGV